MTLLDHPIANWNNLDLTVLLWKSIGPHCSVLHPKSRGSIKHFWHRGKKRKFPNQMTLYPSIFQGTRSCMWEPFRCCSAHRTIEHLEFGPISSAINIHLSSSSSWLMSRNFPCFPHLQDPEHFIVPILLGRPSKTGYDLKSAINFEAWKSFSQGIVLGLDGIIRGWLYM